MEMRGELGDRRASIGSKTAANNGFNGPIPSLSEALPKRPPTLTTTYNDPDAPNSAVTLLSRPNVTLYREGA